MDRIDELKYLDYAIGTKCVTLSEDFFDDHFPGHPVYPGALITESLAQLGGALLELSLRDTLGYSPRCVLSSAKSRFREFARPGDSLTLRVDILSRHEDSALIKSSATCSDRRICEAELLFVYLRIDDPRLEAARRDFLDIITRHTKIILDA